MADEWQKAARNLSDAEIKEALRELLEHASEPSAGIIRQILGEENKSLSDKQQHVYDNYIEPSLVEKCGRPGCGSFVVAGRNFCPTCDVDFG